MDDLLRLVAPLLPALGLFIERREGGGLLTLGALPLLMAGVVTDSLDPLHGILAIALCVRGWRAHTPVATSGALGMLCFDDPRLVLLSGTLLLLSQGGRRALAPLLLFSAATAYLGWGDLSIPPQLSIHPQLAVAISVTLAALFSLRVSPLLAGLLLFRGFGALAPEVLTLGAPWLAYLAPLVAGLAFFFKDKARALPLTASAVILLGALTATSLGLLGALITAVLLTISHDEPEVDPLMMLPGAGLGLLYVLYAASTSARISIYPGLLLLGVLSAWWLLRFSPKQPSLLIAVGLVLMAPLPAERVAEPTAARWSRDHPPCDDRWGWRALWWQEHPNGGVTPGAEVIRDAGIKP